MPLFYIDSYYFLLVVPAIIIALLAQWNVSAALNKYGKIASSRGMTGESAARRVLDSAGVRNVTITTVAGNATDHYDPKSNTIRLSESVYASSSIAAVGVAAHEAGHAIQYSAGYAPIKIRAAIIPITNIGSTLAIPLVLIGLLFSFYPIAIAGVAFFALSVIFQLVTLPVEFNASRRALEAIDAGGLLSSDEIPGAKAVLRAAALTYVAALLVSLANMIRLFALVNRRR